MDEVPLKEEPPSNQVIMDSGAGVIFTLSALVKRPKGIRAIWESGWDFCPIRSFIHSRRIFVLKDISKKEIGG